MTTIPTWARRRKRELSPLLQAPEPFGLRVKARGTTTRLDDYPRCRTFQAGDAFVQGRMIGEEQAQNAAGLAGYLQGLKGRLLLSGLVGPDFVDGFEASAAPKSCGRARRSARRRHRPGIHASARTSKPRWIPGS